MWILIVLGAVGLTAVATGWLQRRVTARRAQRTPEAGGSPNAETTPDAWSEFGPVKFLLYQDNAGGYYWTIVDHGGEVLARSTGFASYPEANFAADIVHRAAGSATFENRSGTTPPTRPLALADDATRRDRPEPEPPSQAGGSVSREEVTRQARAARSWPAGSSSTPGGRRR